MGFISGLLGAKNNFQSNPYYMDVAAQGQQQGIGSATGGQYAGAIGNALGGGFGINAGQQAIGQAQQGLGDLASQLQAQANGQGPSLAQNQLKEATDRNANLAAGAIASQRGINPALAARMITGQQAAANQQAAGQSADLRMQEQMAARQQLAGVLGQQMQGGLGQFGAGAGFLGTLGQLGQGQQQLSQNDYLAAYNRMLEGTEANQRQQMTADQINAGVQGQNAQTNAGIFGGLLGGAAGALGVVGKPQAKAHGGLIQPMAQGGKVALTPKDMGPADKAQMDTSTWGLDGGPTPKLPGTRRLGDEALQTPQKMALGGLAGALQGFGAGMAGTGLGGPSIGTPGLNSGLVSLGQALRQRFDAMRAAQPDPTADESAGLNLAAPPMTMMGGGHVPGHASVPGDSEKNDKVPALLSPGEIVIPRSKAKDPDAAKEFVEAIAKHEGPKEEEAEGYGKVLQHTRDLHERLKKIEHALGGMI